MNTIVLSFHLGGTAASPRWNACLTQVGRLSHPGGTMKSMQEKE